MINGSCHYSMVHPQVMDKGEDFQIHTVATNMLNKQSMDCQGVVFHLGICERDHKIPL